MGSLFDLYRIGYKQHSIPDVVKKARPLRINKRQVFVQSVEPSAPLQPILILAQMVESRLVFGTSKPFLQASDPL